MKGLAEACGCFPTGKHYAGIAHLVRIQATGIVEGFAAEGEWIDMPIALVDVETTGRDAQADRVVEIAVVLGKSGAVLDRKSWLVNPGRPIPEETRAVHGISDDMVANQPPFGTIADEVIAAFRGAIPAAYNASFDRAFLLAELRRAGRDGGDALPPSLAPGVEWFDPLIWARALYQFEKGKSLSDMTARLGIAHETAHRATDDAEAALRVLYALAKDVRVPRGYAGFTQEQRRLGRAQEEERMRWRGRQGG